MAGVIDYGGMMMRAAQRMIAQVLTDVARSGLPGEHHFFITFDTSEEGVELADWLRESYPETMTIVLQEWFDNLVVDANSFSITLNFGNQPERMTIPFSAMRSFVDPSVEFGLRFAAQDEDEDEEGSEDGEDIDVEILSDDEAGDGKAEPVDDRPARPSGGAEVVSLDQWRK